MLVIARNDKVVVLAPLFRETPLTAIENGAVWFLIETEPTWATLRHDMLARLNPQALRGSVVASLPSIAVSLVAIGWHLKELVHVVCDLANQSPGALPGPAAAPLMLSLGTFQAHMKLGTRFHGRSCC
jgi:hypothetical protein